MFVVCFFQELEPSVGEVLCRMFEDDLTIDLQLIQRHAARRSRGGDNKSERFDILVKYFM